MVVTFLASSFCFRSILIASINLGILYSFLSFENGDTWLFVANNLFLAFILSPGFFAMFFSIASIKIHFNQIGRSPRVHTCVLWLSFLFANSVAMCSIVQMLA